MSLSERVQNAATKVIKCLTDLQPKVDDKTGLRLADQVDFSLVGVATPVAAGGDYKVDVYTAFIAKTGTTGITADHRRMYCPCVRAYVGDLTNVAPNSDCSEAAWTVKTKKRATEDTSSSEGTYHGTVPGTGVNQMYGSPSSMVIAQVGLFLAMLLFAVFM
jgi:hypothetical protein